MDEQIFAKEAPEPIGPYPHARRAGNLLFLSGIGPRKRGTREIPGITVDEAGNVIAYDIELQCRSAVANVKAVLEAAGSHWGNLVDVTVLRTNLKDDCPSYNRGDAEHFLTNRPSRAAGEDTE